MSLGKDAVASRTAALNTLRFNKLSKKQSTPPRTFPAANVARAAPVDPAHGPYGAPPSQSRDGTVSSRYFPPPNPGNVLVPSSSPAQPEPSYSNHSYYGDAYSGGGVSGSVHSSSDSWGQAYRTTGHDALSAPSFAGQHAGNHASLARPWGSANNGMVHGSARDEEEPPRKRVNRGPSDDPIDLLQSPGSPAVMTHAQQRAMPSGTSNLPISIADGSPRPGSTPLPPASRIIRGERPEAQPSPGGPPDRFTRFSVTMPMHPPPIVRRAWDEVDGDVQKATQLLSDNAWLARARQPPAPSAPGTPSSSREEKGRVKEIEEANRAQRMAEREKGKKSMIYAKREPVTLPPLSTPPPATKSRAEFSAALLSPETPAVAPPRRKRPKQVVMSDSEAESSDEEEVRVSRVTKRGQQHMSDEDRALDYFNVTSREGIQELTGCTPEQASTIISLRPFSSVNDLNEKLGQGKKKAGPSGISPRMFGDCTSIFEGYGAVDSILQDCEEIGADLRVAIATFTAGDVDRKGKGKSTPSSSSRGTPALDQVEDGALSLRTITAKGPRKPSDFLESQPNSVSKDVQLKEYQLLGVNWLNLLYRKRLSCILADEMGLGKTIQVISFFAHLKEHGSKGPHLVIVPSSTLENWCREFDRFAPSISVQTYYADKADRPALRANLYQTCRAKNKHSQGWEVLITTYNLASGNDKDRKFFRNIEWESAVFDEGHVLKNFESQRYQGLVKYPSKWRLLLTGTPLQNNLQELVSLMNFILPDQFAESLQSLRAIFKVKGDTKVSLLAQERVSRAKKMMTPFVLRRRKDQVLNDLPKKTERIEWCDMTDLQKTIYNDALQRSRREIVAADVPGENGKSDEPNGKGGRAAKKKPKAKGKDKAVSGENSTNVLMDLRKASSHPMLFRTRFTDTVLTNMTKQLLKEADFKKRGAVFQYVKEDMQVMTDAELQVFAGSYKSTKKFLQDEQCFLEAGKVTVLLKLLDEYRNAGRKILVFSQFTQILDILKLVLDQKEIKYLILTGSTAVDVRQTLVDEFTEDESIEVFLLSTKAGGMGINLTAASVVILFDQDFNPHNDKQAQDRAYRIGQKRDVEVVKLITRGTIEVDMLKLGHTKLALDEAVAGDESGGGAEGGEGDESNQEKEMKRSLMDVLRRQLEEKDGSGEGRGESGSGSGSATVVDVDVDMENGEKAEDN